MNYRKLALVDLHLHLDGSLSPEVVIEIAKDDGVELPSYDPKEIYKRMVCTDECSSLVQFLEKFDIPALVLQTKNGLRKSIIDLIKRLSEQGLKYAEIRMAPQLSCEKGLTQDNVVSTLIDAMKEANQKYNFKSQLILCMMRGNNNYAQNMETVKVTRKYLNKGVCALDIAGAESLFPNEMFVDQFALAKDLEVPFTIHAGEASGPESVRSALDMGAVRIGHGIKSIYDEKLMNELAERKIPLEMCPVSNHVTKEFPDYDKMPIKEFVKRGIVVTLNSDDMAPCNTTLVEQYEILAKHGYSDEILQQIAINTINSAFISDKEKQVLVSLIK